MDYLLLNSPAYGKKQTRNLAKDWILKFKIKKKRAKINCAHLVKGTISNANKKKEIQAFERDSGFNGAFIQTVYKVPLYKNYFPSIARYETQMFLKELYFTLEFYLGNQLKG